MNERYLFRGKQKDNGKWVEGDLMQWNDGTMRICVEDGDDSKIARTVIPETVGQCTGLKDKNGKWIFENYIVSMPAYGGGRTKSVVYFKNGKFAVDGSNYAFKDICPGNMEVIGNIHDNPELLEAKA